MSWQPLQRERLREAIAWEEARLERFEGERPEPEGSEWIEAYRYWLGRR